MWMKGQSLQLLVRQGLQPVIMDPKLQLVIGKTNLLRTVRSKKLMLEELEVRVALMLGLIGFKC